MTRARIASSWEHTKSASREAEPIENEVPTIDLWSSRESQQRLRLGDRLDPRNESEHGQKSEYSPLARGRPIHGIIGIVFFELDLRGKSGQRRPAAKGERLTQSHSASFPCRETGVGASTSAKVVVEAMVSMKSEKESQERGQR